MPTCIMDCLKALFWGQIWQRSPNQQPPPLLSSCLVATGKTARIGIIKLKSTNLMLNLLAISPKIVSCIKE